MATHYPALQIVFRLHMWCSDIATRTVRKRVSFDIETGVVPKPVDELLMNVPNPLFAVVSGFGAALLSVSVLPKMKAPTEAKGLYIAVVDGPSSAAESKDAKVSAEL